MRIVCPTLEEFIENLDDIKARGGTLFEDTIRVSSYRRPQGDNRRNASLFDVVLQASAVVTVGEGQYVLETGIQCGPDYEDKSQERLGSAEAARVKGVLKAAAERHGWRLMSGIIDQVF